MLRRFGLSSRQSGFAFVLKSEALARHLANETLRTDGCLDLRCVRDAQSHALYDVESAAVNTSRHNLRCGLFDLRDRADAQPRDRAHAPPCRPNLIRRQAQSWWQCCQGRERSIFWASGRPRSASDWFTWNLGHRKSAAEDPVRVLRAERITMCDEFVHARGFWLVQGQRSGSVYFEAVVYAVDPRDCLPLHSGERERGVPPYAIRTAARIIAECCVFSTVGKIEWLVVL